MMTVMQVELRLSVLVDVVESSEDFEKDAMTVADCAFMTGTRGNFCGNRYIIMSHHAEGASRNPHHDELFPEVKLPPPSGLK